MSVHPTTTVRADANTCPGWSCACARACACVGALRFDLSHHPMAALDHISCCNPINPESNGNAREPEICQ